MQGDKIIKQGIVKDNASGYSKDNHQIQTSCLRFASIADSISLTVT